MRAKRVRAAVLAAVRVRASNAESATTRTGVGGWRRDESTTTHSRRPATSPEVGESLAGEWTSRRRRHSGTIRELRGIILELGRPRSNTECQGSLLSCARPTAGNLTQV
jgi:hypothetical protein